MEDIVRIFQIVLFSLCINLLGAVAIIVKLPKPVAPGAGYLVRPQIDAALERAVHLADARNYNEASKLVDDANAFPNKTNPEIGEIGQVRSFVAARQGHP
jgi:hypothetical protein